MYIIGIDLNDIKELTPARPNDPDDVTTLSEISADDRCSKNIDKVPVGSCTTSIGHYRALGEILKDKGIFKTRL